MEYQACNSVRVGNWRDCAVFARSRRLSARSVRRLRVVFCPVRHVGSDVCQRTATTPNHEQIIDWASVGEVHRIRSINATAVLAALLGCYVTAPGRTPAAASSPLGPEFTTPREVKITDPQRSLKSIRIVTWNIDRGTELDLVRSGLERERADLCLLQEVDSNTARAGERDVGVDLAKHLHLNLSYGVEFEELSQEHGQRAFSGQATLTRLPIRGSRILRFATQSGFWKPHDWIPTSIPLMQRRLGGRIALVTEVEFQERLLV